MKNNVIMKTVKYTEDIVETLAAIDKAYREKPTKKMVMTRKKNEELVEYKDTPTRTVVADAFKISEDRANERILHLVREGLIELDSSRSYQTWRAFQKVFRLTGKGQQLLSIFK
jgi:hypothetical protein